MAINKYTTKGKHPRKTVNFWTFTKGKGGFNPNLKVLGSFFLVFVVVDIKKKMMGLNIFQKFWGSFEVVLWKFTVWFELSCGGMFFPKSAFLKLPQGCPKQVGWGRGGGGGGEFWKN